MSAYTIAEIETILLSERSSSNIYNNDINTLTAGVQKIKGSIIPGKIDLLKAYLQKTFNLTIEQLNTQFLPKLINTDINGEKITTALNATFTKDGKSGDLDGLVSLLREMERVKLLFSKLQFEAESITYFTENIDVFGITNLKKLTLNDVKNAVVYKSLVEVNKEMEGKVRDTLKNYQPASHFSTEAKVLSDLWKESQGQIQSLVASEKFSQTALGSLTALEAIKFLWEVQQICQKIGVKGDSLVKLTDIKY
ncbi:MAG: hypothetical protein AAB116_09445, partial [Candidatus Poribacteria bacterium]